MDNARMKKNIVFSFGAQMLIMLLGILVPRLMIGSYGSDTNGFLTTLTQIFGYMALLEAGIGQAAKNALFRPLAEKNRGGVSHIASVADRYFRRFTLIYGVGVLVLAAACPFVIKTQIDPMTVFAVVLLEGVSGVTNFYFIQICTVVLGADGRSYINQTVNLISQAAVYAVKILLAAFGINIVLLQLAFWGLTVIKAVFFRIYFRRKYAWIDFQAAPKTEKLQDRNSYVITEVAWTVFSSTDMIVLSTFVDTKMASVYTVYNLITNSLNSLWNAVYGSLTYILGQAFHKDKAQYMKLHDGFTSVFFGGMTILMCTAYVLMLPFIRLYTDGVTDVEYIHTALPLLFCLVQLISWSRYVMGNLSGLAGYAKQTSRISVIEAVSNVVLSVVLVQVYGIVGVVLATVISLPIKVIYLIWLSEKVILKRNPVRYLVILGANYLYFFAVVFVNQFIALPIHSYLSFMGYGVLVFLVCGILGVLINTAANPECIRLLKTLKNMKG